MSHGWAKRARGDKSWLKNHLKGLEHVQSNAEWDVATYQKMLAKRQAESADVRGIKRAIQDLEVEVYKAKANLDHNQRKLDGLCIHHSVIADDYESTPLSSKEVGWLEEFLKSRSQKASAKTAASAVQSRKAASSSSASTTAAPDTSLHVASAPPPSAIAPSASEVASASPPSAIAPSASEVASASPPSAVAPSASAAASALGLDAERVALESSAIRATDFLVKGMPLQIRDRYEGADIRAYTTTAGELAIRVPLLNMVNFEIDAARDLAGKCHGGPMLAYHGTSGEAWFAILRSRYLRRGARGVDGIYGVFCAESAIRALEYSTRLIRIDGNTYVRCIFELTSSSQTLCSGLSEWEFVSREIACEIKAFHFVCAEGFKGKDFATARRVKYLIRHLWDRWPNLIVEPWFYSLTYKPTGVHDHGSPKHIEDMLNLAIELSDEETDDEK
jgi:hypothetical protein